jgi:hypothetical protein
LITPASEITATGRLHTDSQEFLTARGNVGLFNHQVAADILSDTLPQTIRYLQEYSTNSETVYCSSPVFVFSAGWRSGSTLVQRLICSNGETLIWGEPFGDRVPVCRLAQTITDLSESDPHWRYSIDKFSGDLSTQWVANLNPGPTAIRGAHLAFFEAFLAKPASDRGVKRWGAKWINLTAYHASYLKWLYPQCKIVFLVRNPLDAFRSYKNKDWFIVHGRHQVRGVIRFVAHWNYLAKSFLSEQQKLGALLLKYEDVVSRPEALHKLQDFLGLNINSNVLAQKLDARQKAKLSWWDRLVCASVARSTCRKLGYELGNRSLSENAGGCGACNSSKSSATKTREHLAGEFQQLNS